MFFHVFPGILVMTDHVIPGDVYAWIAVVVLPINSALNPFLYTCSAIFGKKVAMFSTSLLLAFWKP